MQDSAVQHSHYLCKEDAKKCLVSKYYDCKAEYEKLQILQKLQSSCTNLQLLGPRCISIRLGLVYQLFQLRLGQVIQVSITVFRAANLNSVQNTAYICSETTGRTTGPAVCPSDRHTSSSSGATFSGHPVHDGRRSADDGYRDATCY